MSNPYGVPDWNFTILVNDFGDNYWNDDFERECPEAANALMNINRKCSDPAEYEEAVELYNRYIGVAYDFYGGKIAVDFIKKKTGQLPKGIKKPPKLTGHGKKKYIAGAQYDIGKYVPVVSKDEMKQLTEIYNVGISKKEPEYSADKLPRQIRRQLRKDIGGMISRRNARSSYKESTAMYTTDILAQVIMNQDKIINDPYSSAIDSGRDDISTMSLDEHVALYDETHKESEGLPEINVPVAESNDRYYYANSYSSSYSQKLANDNYVLELMKKANLTRFSSKELDRMTDTQKQRYRSVFGTEALMSKKESKQLRKKYKKQTKQYKNDMTKHMSDSNRALASLLSSRSAVNMISEGMDEDE